MASGVPTGSGPDKTCASPLVATDCCAILSISKFRESSSRGRHPRSMGPKRATGSEVSGLLQGQEVLGRQLLAFLEPFEDEFRLSLRVDLFGDLLGDAAALHPDAVDDLVVVVDLADVLDVLPVLLVREHLRLDELLLRPVRLAAQVVPPLVQRGHLIVLRLGFLRQLGDAFVGVLREVPGGLQLVLHLPDVLVLLERLLELPDLRLEPLDLVDQRALLLHGQDGRHLSELEALELLLEFSERHGAPRQLPPFQLRELILELVHPAVVAVAFFLRGLDLRVQLVPLDPVLGRFVDERTHLGVQRVALLDPFARLVVQLVAAPALAERGRSPAPAATTYTLALAADRRSAERNETITYSIWVNVSGGGSLQLVRVNFTLDPDLTLVGAAIVLPSACGTSTSNATFAEWQCSFLRPGRSYRFTVPAVVAANATRGRSRSATAQAIELGAGAATPRIARVPVWILIGVLELQVTALLSSAPSPGSQIYFIVNVTNIIRTDVDPADVQNLTAYNVRIMIGIGPFLDVGITTPRLRTLPYLAPSESDSVNFTGIVNATVGEPISVNATLLYDDVANRSIGPKFAEWVDDVQAPPPLRSDLTSVLAVFSFAVVAIVAAIVIAPILG